MAAVLFIKHSRKCVSDEGLYIQTDGTANLNSSNVQRYCGRNQILPPISSLFNSITIGKSKAWEILLKNAPFWVQRYMLSRFLRSTQKKMANRKWNCELLINFWSLLLEFISFCIEPIIMKLLLSIGHKTTKPAAHYQCDFTTRRSKSCDCGLRPTVNAMLVFIFMSYFGLTL